MSPGWGDFDANGTPDGVLGLGAAIGVQIGSGLLSPYAEVRAQRLVDIDGETGVPTFDRTLVLGNTLNIPATRPYPTVFAGHVAIDAAIFLPMGSRTELGFLVGVGGTMNKAPRTESFELADYTESRPYDDAELMAVRVTASAAGLGAGVEVAHLRFDSSIISTLTIADIAYVPDGMSLSAVMAGREWRFGRSRAFVGATPLAVSWGGYVGYGKFRAGVGTDTALVRLDAGLEAPLYWQDDSDQAYGTGVPVTAFLRLAY